VSRAVSSDDHIRTVVVVVVVATTRVPSGDGVCSLGTDQRPRDPIFAPMNYFQQ